MNGGLLGKRLNKNELHLHRASEFGDPMLLVVAIAKTHQVVLMHQGCHIRRVRRFLDLANKVQFFPLGQRGICINMTMLTSFIHELTQLPLASTLKHMTMVLCPFLEPIVGFLYSRTMVGKSMKVFVDMECDVLIVPPNPTLNVVLCKRTLTMSTRQKSYH